MAKEERSPPGSAPPLPLRPRFLPLMRLCQVAVCFGGRLLRGNRTQKTNSSAYQVGGWVRRVLRGIVGGGREGRAFLDLGPACSLFGVEREPVHHTARVLQPARSRSACLAPPSPPPPGL